MGLACSHDAFRGAYSAFNRLRQAICAATGPDGSYPPHWQYTSDGNIAQDSERRTLYKPGLSDSMFYVADDYDRTTHPGLWEFLTHSDCDGEISPEMCVKVADDLEALLPKIEALGWGAAGHIAFYGGFVAVTRRFIDGCRRAAAANEPLDFH